jgi:hypothetical protein
MIIAMKKKFSGLSDSMKVGNDILISFNFRKGWVFKCE